MSEDSSSFVVVALVRVIAHRDPELVLDHRVVANGGLIGVISF